VTRSVGALPHIVPRRIPALVDPTDRFAADINREWRKSIEGILSAGALLVDAKQLLPHGQFTQMVETKLDFDIDTAQRLMAVSKNPALSNAAHARFLPRSWTTLHELSKAEPEALEQHFSEGRIHPDMERKEAIQLVKATTNGHGAVTILAAPQPIPVGQFRTVVADPPWEYENSATRGSAENHYRTMSLGEIAALGEQLESKLGDSAHLYLWATSSFLRDAFDISEAWGFNYKTTLVWVKPQIGLGNYFRARTEYVLFCTKGNQPTQDRALSNVIEAPRAEHSAKPPEFYQLVEQASPGPFLELFARTQRAGWECWGDEL
jgi:N6-adenosine-specific RNA methylase IME4